MQFYIDPDGFLRSYLPPGYEDYYWAYVFNQPNNYAQIIIWDRPDEVANARPRLRCVVTPVTDILVCQDEALAPGTQKFGYCGFGFAYIGPVTRPDNFDCVAITLVAVPVSP